MRVGDVSLRRELADPKLGAVPRHVWKVPGEPADPGAVRSDARVRIEVASGGDRFRLGAAVDGEADQFVHDIARGLVPLTDAEDRAVSNPSVGVTVSSAGVGSDRDWIAQSSCL